MKLMKYICVCLLMGQIFVTPVLSYAEETDQSTGNNVSEDNKTNPLTDSEDTSNQSGELDEEETIDGNVKNKNAINQSEDTNIEGNIIQEFSNTKSSELEQEEVRETQGVISSMWGTSVVAFESTTGILTVEAGTINNYRGEQFDNNNKIPVSSVKEIVFRDGVVFPANSALLFYETTNLEKVSGPVDTSNVTTMASMFNSSNIENIDVSTWDTSSVTTFYGMFNGAHKLTTLDISSWDTTHADTGAMLYCWSLKYLTLGSKSIIRNSSLAGLRTTLYTARWERIIPEFPKSFYYNDHDFANSYDGSLPGTYTWESKDLSSLNVKNSMLYAGDEWDSKDNFVSATNKEGRSLTVDDLEVEGTVDTSKAGVYEIIYKNGNLSETAKVTVKENKATLKAKDSTLYVGDKWVSEDNFVSATDKDGNKLTVVDLEVEGTVDTSTAGVYEITYKNGSLSEIAKVKVEAKKTGSITLRYLDTYGNPVKDPVDGWEPEPQTIIGNIGESADGDLYWIEMRGWQKISNLPEGIKYEAYPQTYDIVYDNVGVIYISYKDSLGNELKPEERNTDYVSKFDWSLEELPQPVPYEVKPIDIEGYKNTGVEGDPASGSMEFSEPIKRITFIYDKIDNSAINVHDSIIYTGDNWGPIDNFDGAFDKEGNVIDFQNIKVEGFVNSNQAGIYEVKYSYDGVTSVAKITVKENKTNLKVKDATLSVGDKWSPKDNLVFATDKDGNELTVSDLEVEGIVDTSKAGVYEITYKNGSLSETAKITVKDLNENDQTSLEVKDSTLYVGDKWEANDNFISATDKDGNTLKVTDLQIEGVVNTKKAGIYEVTYRNGNLSKIAKVTVKEKPSISTSNGDQGGKQSQDKGSKNKKDTNNTNSSLPKTGEQSTYYLSLMGIILLLSGLVMMYRRVKLKK
ncbi:bacterial Ig-like domain-containing protein [Listeria innocua]|uniref:bacterial Ig-like domain-containing protein n=1 Tax=Listeria innocua TaxID=1642 RepID=UPI0017ADC0E5|nr:bacterial Ig-like domain-containing protein [Listeria innocua]UPH48364.1 bacterial Ig-like domain-containing protein [Listeria innocua]